MTTHQRGILLPLFILGLLPWASVGCEVLNAGPNMPLVDEAPKEVSATPADPFAAPDLGRVVRIFDSRSGEELSLEGMLRRLRDADAVFFGETHLDETTHRLELAVYEGLIRDRSGRVVLAMEMFSRDVQEVIDRYLAGDIEEAEFLKSSRPWGNYATGYRPLVERARQDGLPVYGSNVSASVRRKMGFSGKEGYESLEGEDRDLVARELYPNSDAYWERFARVVRGHAGMMIGDESARLYSTQSLWDNTMGETCALALERHGDHVIFHVNGGFHSAFGEGTVAQFLRRRPGARALTIDVQPTSDLSAVQWREGEPARGDFVVLVEARAQGYQDGAHSVRLSSDLSYRLAMPEGADGSKRVPLLVWLPEEGTRPADVAADLRLRFGGGAAIAVLEQPYPQREESLYLGGRWFWDGSFREDLGAVHGSLQRLCGYVSRYFPVDRERIVIVGRGAGATVVASVALHAQELPAPMFALDPVRYTKLREGALPSRPPSTRSLTVRVTDTARSWWETEAKEYRSAGLEMAVDGITGEESTLIREALGLSATPALAGPPTLLVLRDSSPLARQWARLHQAALQKSGVAAEIIAHSELPGRLRDGAESDVVVLALRGELEGDSGIAVETFSDPRALPVAAGPFGGTTVIVLPVGVGAAERAAWETIRDSGVIKLRSRFAHLELADPDAGRPLEVVLAGIREKGRGNVLIVPAAYCAGPDTMRAVKSRTGPTTEMTVSWLPGLGGRLWRTVEKK